MSDRATEDAQHEMLLKQAIADCDRLKKKLQTLLGYHQMTVRIHEHGDKNKTGNQDNFTV